MKKRLEWLQNLSKERRFVFVSCGLVSVVLVTAFVVLFFSIRSVIRSARELTDAQIGNVLSQTQRLFENYSRFCTNLSVNGKVAEFAALSQTESDDTFALAGYELQKELNSLVSVYGEDINMAALYFPASESVVTIARHLHGEHETKLFFDSYPDLTPRNLETLPSGTWWNAHFAVQASRNWVVHRAKLVNDTPLYIFIEYDMDSFVQRLSARSDELLVFAGSEKHCYYSNRSAPSDDLWSDLLSQIEAGGKFRFDGASYFGSNAEGELPQMRLVVGLPGGHIERIEQVFLVVILGAACLVAISLAWMVAFLNRRVFVPLEKLAQVGNRGNRDMQTVIRAVTDGYVSMADRRDQLMRERDNLVPLALGRLLSRLDESSPGAQKSAESCLWLAGISPSEGYAMFAVTCLEDPQGLFRPTGQESGDNLRLGLFYDLLKNILNDLLFAEHPGTIAILPGHWYSVIVTCPSSREFREIDDVRQRLPGIYAEIFSATIRTTTIFSGTGAAQLSVTAAQLMHQASFLQFWGDEKDPVRTASEQLSFTEYCQAVRKLINRLGAQDYEEIPSTLDEILRQAVPASAEDIQITKNRIYAMTSILVIAINEQLSDEREFVDSMHLEERLYNSETITDFRRELQDVLSALIAHRESVAPPDPSGNLMEQTRLYLLDHYTETGLNVSTVADQFGISVSYLSRSFKEVHGVNLLEYIQRLRVDAAKKLLRDHSIKDVAQMVGFWDSQALVRAFKKYEGIGPGEYKKVLKKDKPLL